MKKNVVSLEEIRSEISDNIGKEVILEADRGRKRIVKKQGVITDAFPSVFTVRVTNDYNCERTVSYSYTDILTSTVKLQIC